MRNDMRSKICGLLIPLATLLCLEPMASASSVTGTIVDVRVSPGASPARVSVLMSNTTSCSTQGWYAFENAADGIGKLWFDVLLKAIATGHQVSVFGTGTCDAFGVEQVSFIDVKPL
jgi:hypothetical protein